MSFHISNAKGNFVFSITLTDHLFLLLQELPLIPQVTHQSPATMISYSHFITSRLSDRKEDEHFIEAEICAGDLISTMYCTA